MKTEGVKSDMQPSTVAGYAGSGGEQAMNVKLFRAQRNLYLTGFTLFLSLLLNRFVSMIIDMADLQKRLETRADSIELTDDEVGTKVRALEEALEEAQLRLREQDKFIQAVNKENETEARKIK
jgi:B-cell receptor-associated protein 31